MKMNNNRSSLTNSPPPSECSGNSLHVVDYQELTAASSYHINAPGPLKDRQPSLHQEKIRPAVSTRTCTLLFAAVRSVEKKLHRQHLRQAGLKHRQKESEGLDTLLMEVESLKTLNKRLNESVRSLIGIPQQIPSNSSAVSTQSADILGMKYIPGIMALVLFEFIVHRQALGKKERGKQIFYPDYDAIVQQVPSLQLLILMSRLHANWAERQ